MTIGSSKGAFYQDEFHEVAADWIQPEDIDDDIVKQPDGQKDIGKVIQDNELKFGGLEI